MATLLLVFSVSMVYAQNIQVKGVVTDASTGEPIPFASIQLKGTLTGVSADIAGNYVISVPANATIIITSIGYKDAEVAVNNRSQINVAISPDSEVLGDVLVVAYGTVRREAKTGSVSSVNSETIAEAPVSSVDKLIAGKMAGVQVSSETGQPGGNSQIRIRGTSSINAGNEPLWVVDGIPVMSGDQSYFSNTSNAMAIINPSDIESLTVLKDAAAASIYGSRAANGVILVQTKSGKAGKARFSARAKVGASKLANDNNFRALTGPELLDYFRVATINAGGDPDLAPSATVKNPYYYPTTILDNELTDWMDAFTRVGTLQEYEINAQAGTDKGKFYSSIAYQKNDGIVYASSFEKLTGRVNSDYSLTKTLTMGTRINLAYTESVDTEMQSLYYSNPMWGGLRIKPWTPFYDEFGNYNVNISEHSKTNPLYVAKCHGEDQWEKQYRVQGAGYLQWEPIKGLVFKTNNMYEGTFGEGIRYWGPDPGPENTTGTLQTSNTQYIQLTTSNTATYNMHIDDHSFRFLVGQEAMRRKYQSYYAYAPGVDANMPFLNTSIAEKSQVDYGENTRTMLSFFGNVDYSYASKYFVQASIRGDGSSLFGEENRWGLFWSASASWNISSEPWMKNTSNWLSLLKLRLSYGVNGNNNIAPYRAYALYTTSAYNGGNGMLPNQPSNNTLSWEKNNTWNVGLDFAFLDNRINGQLDVYSRETKDMLLDKSVPATSGFTSNFMNIGSMTNKGVEFQIDGDIIRNQNLVWNVGLNLAFNKSKIVDLGDNDWIASSYDSRLIHVVGKGFYTFYMKDYYGVNPSNGEALWRADNTDTEDPDDYILTNDYNKARYTYGGSPEPKMTGGFNTSISWKGLNLSAFLEFKTGNKVYLGELRYLMSDGNQTNNNHVIGALNYWKQPGDTNVEPKPIIGRADDSYNSTSTRWIQKGDYLRIKDITLSYDIPKSVIEKIKLKGIKVYVSAINLYTFHDVKWFDPERGQEGMGWGIYPHTKTIAGGIEISF